LFRFVAPAFVVVVVVVVVFVVADAAPIIEFKRCLVESASHRHRSASLAMILSRFSNLNGLPLFDLDC